MPKLPGVNHQDAIRAFEKAGFRIARQGKHITMTNGFRQATIPRNNPINAITMAKIVLGAGLTLDDFRRLL
ncbi:MAG: type II toxin-antitoxin system HicA family toxin [Planctomycetota bacterium]|nr:type II toxin-antitoxin system HicA family toxin [Planctomycetaceae bacterium]MDQ3329429.1 type II toxin-antitoxin system HicA family toxin [Planctomycetota bacterium]